MAKKATKATAPVMPKIVAKPLHRIDPAAQRQKSLYEAAQRRDDDEFARIRDGRE